jgi:flagellar hook-length control protein FliK
MTTPAIPQAMSTATTNISGLFSAQGAGAASVMDLFSAFFADLTGFLSGQGEIPALPVGLQKQADALLETPMLTPEQAATLSTDELSTVVTVEVTIVKIVLTKASANGTLDLSAMSDTDALAYAYEQLGLSPEEARSRAEQVTALMDLLDERLKKSKGIEGVFMGGSPALAQLLQSLSADASVEGASWQRTTLTFTQMKMSTTTLTGQLAARILNGDALVPATPATATPLETLASAVPTADTPDLMPTLQTAGSLTAPMANTDLIALVEKATQILTKVAEAESKTAPVAVAAEQATAPAATTAAAAPALTATIKPSGVVKDIPVTDNAAVALDIANPDADELVAKVDRTPQPQLTRTEDAAWRDPAVTPARADAAAPANPMPTTYVVQPATDGSYQVIDPSTGQVVDVQARPVLDTSRAANFADRVAELAARAAVAHQVKVHVRTLAGYGGGMVSVSLAPAELGQIRVNLKIEDTKVHGEIIVQRPEVMDQLARDLKVLQQGLADAGLTLDTQGLTFSLQDDGNQRGGNGSAFAQGRNRDEGLTEAETATATWADPERLVDVNV